MFYGDNCTFTISFILIAVLLSDAQGHASRDKRTLLGNSGGFGSSGSLGSSLGFGRRVRAAASDTEGFNRGAHGGFSNGGGSSLERESLSNAAASEGSISGGRFGGIGRFGGSGGFEGFVGFGGFGGFGRRRRAAASGNAGFNRGAQGGISNLHGGI